MPITPELPDDRFAANLSDSDIVKLVAAHLGYEEYGPGWSYNVVHPTGDKNPFTTVMARKDEPEAKNALILP